ncbi:MAG TPA: chorismate mutase [Gaiellaceae bacterium]|jgi:chorismate mutase|nr:chorismate mutase [Gaiellaceae bacterium]
MSGDVVSELRKQIDELDREIVVAVNRRLELVAALKRHKDEHGIAFVDPHREEQMLAERERENAGPLSVEGLRSFYAGLLALCKRELG